MTVLPRPLSPLERALLRAVVALGDNATAFALTFRVEGLRVGDVCAAMEQLERDGFVVWTQEGRGWISCCWRPAFDLRAMLSESDVDA